MFGFLFKKNKNPDKESSKHGKHSQKENNTNEKCTTAPTSISPLVCQNSLNLVSVSTDSLSASVSESGKESGKFSLSATNSSTASLVTTAEGSCTYDTDTGIKVSETEGDSIGFIDELQAEEENIPSTIIIKSPKSFTEVVDDAGSGCHHDDEKTKRQLNEAEGKAMVQVEAIRSKLISKETELSLLQADINMLAVDRDNKSLEVQSLVAQLNVLQKENELALQKLNEFEIQLDTLRSKNCQLAEEVQKKSEQLKCLQQENLSKPYECVELNAKIKDMEEKIRELESAKQEVSKDRDLIEKENGSRIKALQDALEDALEAKIKLQTKYEKDLGDMQQSNATMVDDFEWKLHQVESTCRKKLQEKDRQIEEHIKQAKLACTINFSAEKGKLEEERKAIQLQLRQVEHLKSFEAEVIQLRGVTNEQQKSLRAAARQLDQFKVNERLMQSEIKSLKIALEQEKNACQVITNSSQRRMNAQELSVVDKLAKQKDDLNAKWESKLQIECAKMKVELRKLHEEEKRSAVESIKLQKEKALSVAQEMWERARQELVQDISKLKEEMKAKESTFQKDIAKATTIIDRDNWELRRKLEKISDEHMEELDALKDSHSEEMELLRTRYDSTVAELEKLQKTVEEYEKTSRSTDSFLTEKDSGIIADTSSKSVVDRDRTTNEDCSYESAEEESEEEEEESEEEDAEDTNFTENNNTNNAINTAQNHNAITELREEVASLQDSIETLTLKLVENEPKEENLKKELIDTPTLVNESSDTTTSEADTSSSFKSTGNESSAVSDTDNESDEAEDF